MIYWKHIMPFRSDEHTHGLWIWWTSRAAQRRTRRTLKVGIYISNRRQYLEYFSHRRYPHSHPLININQTSRQWFCDALIYPYFGGKASGAVNEWKPPNRPQCISFRGISYIVGLVWCGIVLRSAVWCVSCDARLRPSELSIRIAQTRTITVLSVAFASTPGWFFMAFLCHDHRYERSSCKKAPAHSTAAC